MLSTRSHKVILSIIHWLIFVRNQSKFCFARQSLILKWYLKAYMPLIVKDWYSVTWKLLWDKSLFMTLWDLLVPYCAMKFDSCLEYFPFFLVLMVKAELTNLVIFFKNSLDDHHIFLQSNWFQWDLSSEKLASCTWVLRIWITVILKTAQYKRID